MTHNHGLPVGSTATRIIQAVAAIAPKGSSVLVLYIVPSDVDGVDAHATHAGDTRTLFRAVAGWMQDHAAEAGYPELGAGE